ncbi:MULTISPECIES: ABC transporter permease [unclassified Shinella]|uniref:ABC transporter permease n=1 Tax=unclassified Shinella TaxID=2643062 RepID=UPI00234E62DC|nr:MULTISPECIES: ABC transporter permease [unclassified Shinella]MCO5149262.1 ABC transporter permease [Shinella sp.]MDC7265316.1 ABC transporter permease [Shinella sp. HY16]MDC7272213.1 ABC transporter permease [Shinella sp. YZ44]
MNKVNTRMIGNEIAMPFFLVIFVGVVSLIEPRFVSAANLRNLAAQIAPLMIIAIGQAFTVIAGGLDLSIAAIMAFSAVIGILAVPEFGLVGGLACMMLVGGLVGLVNGVIISRLNASPLIVTLGIASIAEALALILSNGVPLYAVPKDLVATIGFGRTFGFNNSFLLALAMLVLGAFLLRRTVFGRYVYAMGSNRSAAMKSGINVLMVTTLVYTLAGVMAGVAAIVMTAWISAATPVAPPGLTLQSIAAVVLGGVLLTGGAGGMHHVLYGVLVLGTLTNALNMLGISSYFQTLAIGVVIIAAVSLDVFRKKGHS